MTDGVSLDWFLKENTFVVETIKVSDMWRVRQKNTWTFNYIPAYDAITYKQNPLDSYTNE